MTDPGTPLQPPEWMRSIVPETLDSRVLDQDRYWVTREGTTLELASMTDEHLANVVTMLVGLAVTLHFNALLDALADLLEAEHTGQATAEQITHELTGTNIATLAAEAWVEAHPLLRGIRRMQASRT